MLSKKLVKPQQPMDPKNSNWDKPLDERVTELENKFLDFQVNVFQILKSILDEAEKEMIDKKLNENSDDEEAKEEKVKEEKNANENDE